MSGEWGKGERLPGQMVQREARAGPGFWPVEIRSSGEWETLDSPCPNLGEIRVLRLTFLGVGRNGKVDNMVTPMEEVQLSRYDKRWEGQNEWF